MANLGKLLFRDKFRIAWSVLWRDSSRPTHDESGENFVSSQIDTRMASAARDRTWSATNARVRSNRKEARNIKGLKSDAF
jgi:hypothetical protein